jgi:hypothetical protein
MVSHILVNDRMAQNARLIVFLLFAIVFVISLILGLPSVTSLPGNLQAIFYLMFSLAFGTVLISYWVYDDGKKIDSLEALAISESKIVEKNPISNSDSKEDSIEAIDQAEKKKRIIDQYRKKGVPSPEENLNARIIVKIKLEGKQEHQVIDEIYENEFPKR